MILWVLSSLYKCTHMSQLARALSCLFKPILTLTCKWEMNPQLFEGWSIVTSQNVFTNETFHAINIFVTSSTFLVVSLHRQRDALAILVEWLRDCGTYIEGPLHTQGWEPVTVTLQALSLVEKAEPVQVHTSHYGWGTNGVGGCKVYMALNGSCFMVVWTNLKTISWR